MNRKLVFLMTLSVVFLVALAAAGCSGKPATAPPDQQTPTTLRIGAAVVPHAEILNSVKPKLKDQGVNLDVVILDDEAQLNPALQDKQIDANYFQHVPYLDSVSKEKGYEFSVVAKIHVEPIGFYSEKHTSKDQLPDGAKIAIPNNPSNEYRALVLLEKNGLVKLKEGIPDYIATPADITDNPKNLKFVEIEAAQLTRTLPDVDGAVINTNFVLDAEIDPDSALFREEADSPYANIVVVRKGDESRPEIQKLVETLQTPEVKQFILDIYKGAVVPAF